MTNAEYNEPTTKNDLVPRNVVERIIKSPRTKEQMLLVLNSLPSQEPTIKNNLGVDCISRQSVLDKIQRLIDAEQNNIDENGDYMNYARERVNAYEAIQFFVENDCLCPSVTPQEPRKGYWLHRPHVYGVTYCSICDFELKIDNTNYCPHCGAKMESEVDNGNDD